ncbi:MAG: single-stranded DNA-binding protein [Gemmatimonadales bacterium]|jgi:single-strand DNA-binding protein|nr:single-stranded DNA-binding protein [Gemmatimonadales bacterium]MDZ4257828.1 single-stranded DNA-binding protein [Gemmatimonadales bacterium]MDZ4389830.1 single-stranded DNA-binding protein [Gemmatimonadales bacterium]
MSKSLNKVILIGNLGADPEVRSTSAGGRVATLSLATSRQWKGADGQRQEKTQWHRVICWNNKVGAQLADIAERYCKKGEKVYIEGEIEYRSWQDKEGQTRYSTEINARELILLGGKDGAGEGGGGGASWSGSRSNAPAAKAAAGGKKDESFADLPDALDAEDDDLPF